MGVANTLQINVPLDISVPGSSTANSGVWTNTYGIPIYIFMGYIWVGVSQGDKGDVAYQLLNVTQNIIYSDSNADHYGELGEKKDWIPNMSPHYFVVVPGDTLRLTLIANADAGTPLVAQSYARLYFTLMPV